MKACKIGSIVYTLNTEREKTSLQYYVVVGIDAIVNFTAKKIDLMSEGLDVSRYIYTAVKLDKSDS